MQIEQVRIVNGKLDGETDAPTTYFMDVNVTDENVVAVPITQETFAAITNIQTQFGPITDSDPTIPLGVPA